MTLRRNADAHDWLRGPLSAAATLIEYGDFECPFCGRAYPQVERLVAELGDRLGFVFRHFPITQIHPHAELAAEAAEAAGAQGRFWEMHHLLFENQQHLEPSALFGYAGRLGLDMRRFALELDTHRHLRRVRNDFIEGLRSGVNGTPTFFVNSERYEGQATARGLRVALSSESPSLGL